MNCVNNSGIRCFTHFLIVMISYILILPPARFNILLTIKEVRLVLHGGVKFIFGRIKRKKNCKNWLVFVITHLGYHDLIVSCLRGVLWAGRHCYVSSCRSLGCRFSICSSLGSNLAMWYFYAYACLGFLVLFLELSFVWKDVSFSKEDQVDLRETKDFPFLSFSS